MRPKRVVLLAYPDEFDVSLRAFLLETRGFRVLRATNGADALLALAAAGPGAVHAIAADPRLPDMSGWELVRRASEFDPELRTLITACSPDVKSWEIDRNMADGFLPYRTPNADFVERIRVLAGRKRGPRKAELQAKIDAASAKRPVQRVAIAAAAETKAGVA